MGWSYIYVHGCQLEVLEGEELIFGVKMWIGGLYQELGLFDGQFGGCEDDLGKFRRTNFWVVVFHLQWLSKLIIMFGGFVAMPRRIICHLEESLDAYNQRQALL